MTKENSIFLSDEYCEKFKHYGVMSNKEASIDGLHRRPCFYSVVDCKILIYWMIPVSSQVDKYRKILNNKLKKYKVYDGLEFGYVQGREATFLLQNICPVKKGHVVEEYINESNSRAYRYQMT